MKVFATKEFSRFARRERIADHGLCEAVRRAARGLVDADLGGGLVKQRVPRPGQGRSGGFRILMAFRKGERCVFLYGFPKSERDDIGDDERVLWRKLAGAYLATPEGTLEGLIDPRS